MNYLREVPRELLYTIISYVDIITDLDNLIKFLDAHTILSFDHDGWADLSRQIFPYKQIKTKYEYCKHALKQNLVILGRDKYYNFENIDISQVGQVLKVACGRYFNIILNTENELFSFGLNNHSGILGIGDISTINKNQIYKIQGDYGKIVQISCGAEHAALMNEAGDLYMWGYNAVGQLGLGDYLNRLVPTKVNGNFGKVKYISCGYFHTGFINDKNQLFMCGQNSYRCIPTSHLNSTKKFILIEEDVIHVECGYSTTAIIKNQKLHMYGEVDKYTVFALKTRDISCDSVSIGSNVMSIQDGYYLKIYYPNLGLPTPFQISSQEYQIKHKTSKLKCDYKAIILDNEDNLHIIDQNSKQSYIQVIDFDISGSHILRVEYAMT